MSLICTSNQMKLLCVQLCLSTLVKPWLGLYLNSSLSIIMVAREGQRDACLLQYYFSCCFIWCFSFCVLSFMHLSTQGSLCHYTPHYPLKWHSLFESKWGPKLTTSRGLTAETKRTLNWMKCQQICLLSWVMDLARTLFQQYSVFKPCCSSTVFNLMKLIFCILLSTHITEIKANANMYLQAFLSLCWAAS